ncbi:unnamed protein product [Fusarium fujikuroi]|uniref:Uncharacterized protein n=1 Tax=Fusarium fujikuroi TaxID=5127 RepID=A0A9Q9UEX9_FUSFU|nr:unnamed protein product [Fusarium fujikuroi]VTT79110.1 unnamed protein product [Fusarium fujikuroi]VZI20283.1 unnamed protein product [Fusarium fujikuroi]
MAAVAPSSHGTKISRSSDVADARPPLAKLVSSRGLYQIHTEQEYSGCFKQWKDVPDILSTRCQVPDPRVGKHIAAISPQEYLYAILNAADTDDKWNAYSPQLQAEIDAFMLSRPDKYFKQSIELIASILILKIAKIFTVSLVLPVLCSGIVCVGVIPPAGLEPKTAPQSPQWLSEAPSICPANDPSLYSAELSSAMNRITLSYP